LFHICFYTPKPGSGLQKKSLMQLGTQKKIHLLQLHCKLPKSRLENQLHFKKATNKTQLLHRLNPSSQELYYLGR
jgi:hypothetical protein